MGCGKSYVGKRLAKQLGASFIDLDQYLEVKENRTIKSMFEKEGEDYFRIKEKACLREMVQFENTIISTGGGTPCFFDNAAWMKADGVAVYLQTPVEVIIKNLKLGMEKRPLLKGLSPKELKIFIEKKLAEREAFYQNVHIVYQRQIEGDEVVKELANYLKMFDTRSKNKR